MILQRNNFVGFFFNLNLGNHSVKQTCGYETYRMLEKVLGEIEFDMDTQILAYEMN